MRETYYIKLGYDPKLVEDLKKISPHIVLLLLVYIFNSYKLKIETFFNAIYDIIIYILIYSHLFEPKPGDFGNTKEKIAFALMAESLIISFQDYYYTKTNFFFWERDIKVSIAPNMISLIISISYNISLMVRNNIKFGDNLKGLIMQLMNIVFFSTLISVFFSNNYLYIPIYGETNFNGQTFGILLVIFSWTCMKSINIIIYPLLAFLSMYRLGEVNKAMGNAGVVYLLCSYISLYLQFLSGNKIEDRCGEYFSKLKSEMFSYENPSNNSNNEFNANSLNRDIERRVREKLVKEKTNSISKSLQNEIKIINPKDGKNIKLILKKLDKTKYDININESEKIIKLKEELVKIDETYKNNILIFIWKGKTLENNEYIYSYGLKDEDVIVFLKK